jgi:hypothetical protein
MMIPNEEQQNEVGVGRGKKAKESSPERQNQSQSFALLFALLYQVDLRRLYIVCVAGRIVGRNPQSSYSDNISSTSQHISIAIACLSHFLDHCLLFGYRFFVSKIHSISQDISNN